MDEKNDVLEPTKDQFGGQDRKKKVGNYLLGKIIGEGAFSKIRQGLHAIAREKVAVKIVPKKAILLREYIKKSVRREAMLLQKLEHPNIIRLYEIMETEHSYYLVLELAESGEFTKYLSDKKNLSERECQRYIGQMASAINHMHASNIIHRDLKLENLLLDRDDNVKIIDFGLSNVFCGDSSLNTQCGSPVYAAPEIFCNRKYGPSVDIWSMGICMYAMLTGKLPFVPDPPNNLTLLHTLILRGANIPHTLSEHCSNLLSQMLAVDVRYRIKIDELLMHSFLLKDHVTPLVTMQPPAGKLYPTVPKVEIVRYMTTVFNFQEDDIFYSVIERKMNAVAATYHLLQRRFNAGLNLNEYSVRSQTRLKMQENCLNSEISKSLTNNLKLPVLSSVQTDVTSDTAASKSKFKSYIQLLKDSKIASAHSLLTGNNSNKLKDITFRRYKTRGDISRHYGTKEETGFMPDFILTYSQGEQSVKKQDRFEWEQTFIISKKETESKRDASELNKQNRLSHISAKSKNKSKEDGGKIDSVDIVLQAPPTTPVSSSIPNLDSFLDTLAPHLSNKETDSGKSMQIIPKREGIPGTKNGDDHTKLKTNVTDNSPNIEDLCHCESWNTFQKQKVQLSRGIMTNAKRRINISYGRPITKPQSLNQREAKSFYAEFEHAQVVGHGRRLFERAKTTHSKMEELHSLWTRNIRTNGDHHESSDFANSKSTEGCRTGGLHLFRAVDSAGVLQFSDGIQRSQLYNYRPLTSPKQTVVDGVMDVIRVHITSSARY